MVAPRAGAWIETTVFIDTRTEAVNVAPRAGAWIETVRSLSRRIPGLSLPVRERGLKLYVHCLAGFRGWSLPVRERGLKHFKISHKLLSRPVAPRAGAWIETLWCEVVSSVWRVAPRAGAWIETLPPCYRAGVRRTVAPRAGAWIET